MVTDASGNYIFSGLANGTYTVTPTNTGYTFSPVNQNVTVNGANQTGVNFTATAQVPHTVALSWTGSTSTVASYNLYRSTVNGTGYVKIGSTLSTILSYTDTTVQNGTTYYYVATAVDGSGNESAYSNPPATAVIP
jgi:fibronectin type 3 domain-containing protein